MPCSVTMCIDATEEKEIEHLKKMIYFMFPNIKNTSKYGVHHLIELDATPVGVLARPTCTARPRGIPSVAAIPMDGQRCSKIYKISMLIFEKNSIFNFFGENNLALQTQNLKKLARCFNKHRRIVLYVHILFLGVFSGFRGCYVWQNGCCDVIFA